MQNYLKVIKAPIITEKSASMADKNTVVFSVNTVNLKPKKRRVGKYTGTTNRVKKAIVKLKEGSSIELN